MESVHGHEADLKVDFGEVCGNYVALVSAFGGNPEFHDAEVKRIVLDAGVQTKAAPTGPTIRISLELYPQRTRIVRTDLIFVHTQIDELEGFAHLNTVDEINIETLTNAAGATCYSVEFLFTYGMHLKFTCFEMHVGSVIEVADTANRGHR